MAKARRGRGLRVRLPRRWWRLPLILVLVPALVGAAAAWHYYGEYAALIDARLAGERDRVLPRVYARPLTLRVGQGLSEADLIARLNDLGYAQRARVTQPGEFGVERSGIVLVPKGGTHPRETIRVEFAAAPAAVRVANVSGASADPAAERIAAIHTARAKVEAITLDPPLLSGLVTGARERRRRVALSVIPAPMQQAVLAIEDRRFYAHPGIDPIRIVGALVTNVRGTRSYLVGASTITQQLARNFFLTDEMLLEQQTGQRSVRRKVLEQFMSLVLERRASKDEILELYLNEVYLGHRGSFGIHGVAQASRMFYGKDVTNVSLAEAALIAGVIQSPGNHSPFASTERARDRRNVVLQAMADAGYVSQDAADAAMREPIRVLARAVDAEAPYFVDYVGQLLEERYAGLTGRPGALDIYTTLDLNVQRAAQEAVRLGLAEVDATLAKKKRPGRAQAALVAVDPRTGELLALVGGRSYNQSQFNRAINARRQPGSVFKPFVYLAAFQKALQDGLTDLTPATMVWDEPTVWSVNEGEWAPRNYEDEYDGHITLRRALALSRNIATIKVAEQVGFDTVAATWKGTKVGKTPPQGYPSIALGVFELTPMEVAEAYGVFPNYGRVLPLRAITRIVSGTETLPAAGDQARVVAEPAPAYLVTNMMRSVINEGTGAGARANGFALDAAGKTGTTNDVRDAWFVGFTPELLAAVWVGFDDNQALGLSGSQAALPIWTRFMVRALAGHDNAPFQAPEGVGVAEIDRDTGKLALPTCPRVTNEAFLAGTEPTEYCELHRLH
jgi:penicillin-binding protein 1B